MHMAKSLSAGDVVVTRTDSRIDVDKYCWDTPVNHGQVDNLDGWDFGFGC
jgi:hypothetical protein